MDNIFEKAAKQKLRFETSKGLLATEDLFDLSLNSLDTLAKATNKKLKEESEESFITTKTTKNTENELKLELLKYVIEYKINLAERSKARADRRAELEVLETLVREKKVEAVKSMSIDDIQKKILELQED